MNATLRRFLFCSLVLAPCLVATPGGAVLIKTQDSVVAPTEKPIEISGRLTLELRDALNTVMAGRYDDAIAQSDRLIGNKPTAAAAPAYEIKATALFLKGDTDAAIAALKRSIELDPKRSSAYTKLGSIDLDAGYLDEARKSLERAIALNDTDRFAHQRLAALLERQGDRAGAIREYTAAIQGIPAEHIGARVDLARLYNLEHRFGDAIGLLQPVVQPESVDTAAALVLGTAYLGKGDPADALALLHAAQVRDHSDPGLALGVGIAERSAGHLDASIASLRRASELKQNWAPAYYQIGLTYLAQKDYPQAQTAFEKAQALAPDSPAVQQELGETLLLDGKPDQAITAFRLLSQRDNARLSDFVALATAYQALGQLPQAEQTYRDGVERFVNDPTAYLRLGALLASEQKYGDARTVLTDGIKIAPNDPRLLRDLALVEARQSRYPDALTTARQLVSLNRQDPDGLFLLATLYQDSGDKAHAIESYRSILADHPDHALALNNLAAMLTTSGDPSAAIPLARRAVALMPRSAALQDTLGWALLKAGQAKDAAVVLQQAHELAPADPEGLYRLAAAQQAVGDSSAARANLRKALAVSPDFKNADAARRMLATSPQ